MEHTYGHNFRLPYERRPSNPVRKQLHTHAHHPPKRHGTPAYTDFLRAGGGPCLILFGGSLRRYISAPTSQRLRYFLLKQFPCLTANARQSRGLRTSAIPTAFWKRWHYVFGARTEPGLRRTRQRPTRRKSRKSKGNPKYGIFTFPCNRYQKSAQHRRIAPPRGLRSYRRSASAAGGSI